MTCKECGYYKKDDTRNPCYPASPDGECMIIKNFGGLSAYYYVSSNDEACKDFVRIKRKNNELKHQITQEGR